CFVPLVKRRLFDLFTSPAYRRVDPRMVVRKTSHSPSGVIVTFGSVLSLCLATLLLPPQPSRSRHLSDSTGRYTAWRVNAGATRSHGLSEASVKRMPIGAASVSPLRPLNRVPPQREPTATSSNVRKRPLARSNVAFPRRRISRPCSRPPSIAVRV